jgi:hypothetical protein
MKSNEVKNVLRSRLGGIDGRVPYCVHIRESGESHRLDVVKDADWRSWVSWVQGRVGVFWTSLFLGVGALWSEYGVTHLDLARILVCYSGQYHSSRLNLRHLEDSMSRVSGGGIPFHDGESMGIYEGVCFNFEREGFELSDWADLAELLGLWGLGWFRHFRVRDGEELRKRHDSAESFNRQLDVVYSGLYSWERLIVDGYVSYWSENSASVPGKPLPRTVVLVDELDMSDIKSMKDWTVEDFWDEVTELYAKCKTRDDVRSVKQILEMKAKSMGILEDRDKGVTNNFIMIQEKAMTALAAMGIPRRVIHEQ